jgi:hypothetical protein
VCRRCCQDSRYFAASKAQRAHLAAASTDEASRKLNELRPKYYDPKRPPAASKAMVTGVGADGKSVTLDMIAVAAP